MQTNRGWYDQIITITTEHGDVIPESDILERFSPALPELGISGSNGCYDAVNAGLYGYCAKQDVAVIQIRNSVKAKKHYFPSVRKTYCLVGFNEITGLPFRHPVSANIIRANVQDGDNPADAVFAAQRWIFQVTAKQLSKSIRQGDVLLVPAKSKPKETTHLGDTLIVAESHRIEAIEIVRDTKNRVWAFDPAIYHQKGQHDAIYGDQVDQWYMVKPGREVEAWSFCQRLKD